MLYTSRVRTADRGDEDEILAMCREMHRENGMFTLADYRVKDLLSRAWNKDGAFIGVIGGRGKLEGMIFLLITNIWYSDAFHLEEMLNFVRPQFRKSNNAEELIRYAKHLSDEIPLPLFMGIMSNIRTEAKVRIYKRQLGEPIGALFLHQPPAKAQSQAG